MLPPALLRGDPAASPAARPRPPAPRTVPPSTPENVVLLIPDGFGPASAALAREYRRHQGQSEALALDPHHVGSVRTHAADRRITDSAAAATAYATATKTHNGSVAVGPDGTPLETILEGAKRRGMATGIVATSRVTHATPASFSAHVPDRTREETIARQQVRQRLDVLLGGGRTHFASPHRPGADEGPSLLRHAERQGHRVLRTTDALDRGGNGPILGLFAPDHMAYDLDRADTAQPSLAAMTRAALDVLAADNGGYVLVVEGSRVDHAAHQNDPAAHLREVLAFDDAVATVLDTVDRESTLVVSVADHETGGLTLGRSRDGQPADTWHPEVLAEVSASAARIACTLDALRTEYESRPLRRGGIEEAVEHFTGIADLTAAECDRLAQDPSPEAVGQIVSRRAQVGWTTRGHTGVDVNLYATGPGARRLAGHHDNTQVGAVLAAALDLDLTGATDGKALAEGPSPSVPGAHQRP
jgi:alkaline phosphatase